MEVCAKGFNFCRVGVDIPDGVQVVQRVHKDMRTHSLKPLTLQPIEMTQERAHP